MHTKNSAYKTRLADGAHSSGRAFIVAHLVRPKLIFLQVVRFSVVHTQIARPHIKERRLCFVCLRSKRVLLCDYIICLDALAPALHLEMSCLLACLTTVCSTHTHRQESEHATENTHVFLLFLCVGSSATVLRLAPPAGV